MSADAALPEKGSALAAGYDLRASEDTVIAAQGKGIVKTGLQIKCPDGTYGRIAPRYALPSFQPFRGPRDRLSNLSEVHVIGFPTFPRST
jgi:hypothetical protein